MAPIVSKEEQILRMMKRVLTDIAKETHVKPGLKHPLSDHCILGIRDCLALITARERELTEADGRPMNDRPVFIDDPKFSKDPQVVQFHPRAKNKTPPKD